MMPPLPKAARGERPFFLADADVERLFTMIVALVGEVSLLQDRVDTLERVGAETGAIPADAVSSYVADVDASAARASRREAVLNRVFRILEADAERAINPSEPIRDVMRRLAGEIGRASCRERV